LDYVLLLVGVAPGLIWELSHDCSKADRFPLCDASKLRKTKAKALPEGFADHNCADFPIFCSLIAIGSMAGSCANPNIGIMT
jgi:hypothetical protein